MRRPGRRASSALLLAAPLAAAAAPLACYEDPLTAAHTCYAPGTLRVDGAVRSAQLWRGGPKGLRSEGYTLHVNCRTGAVHLKDRDGVSFAGGDRNDTPALRALTGWICERPAPKKK